MAETVVDDTLDSTNNMIDSTRPRGGGEVEADKKGSPPSKRMYPALVLLRAKVVLISLQFNQTRRRWVIISAPTLECVVWLFISPWNIMQGDVMTDPSCCRGMLKGMGTPEKLRRLRAGGREYLYQQLALHLMGGSLAGNVVLHDWYSLSQKDDECECLTAIGDQLNNLKLMWNYEPYSLSPIGDLLFFMNSNFSFVI
ncbi:hypothetical protein Hanom_Chr10g00910061 [Helianthus anomalus]